MSSIHSEPSHTSTDSNDSSPQSPNNTTSNKNAKEVPKSESSGSASSSTACKYMYALCRAKRAKKRNGELHRFCEYHRMRANENQRNLVQRRRDLRSKSDQLLVVTSNNEKTLTQYSMDDSTMRRSITPRQSFTDPVDFCVAMNYKVEPNLYQDHAMPSEFHNYETFEQSYEPYLEPVSLLPEDLCCLYATVLDWSPVRQTDVETMSSAKRQKHTETSNGRSDSLRPGTL